MVSHCSKWEYIRMTGKVGALFHIPTICSCQISWEVII